MPDEMFWVDLQDERKWREAARQQVRLRLMDGMTLVDAIADTIRMSRARGAVMDELRDLATEA